VPRPLALRGEALQYADLATNGRNGHDRRAGPADMALLDPGHAVASRTRGTDPAATVTPVALVQDRAGELDAPSADTHAQRGALRPVAHIDDADRHARRRTRGNGVQADSPAATTPAKSARRIVDLTGLATRSSVGY
jgi:hypothetical protein